MLEQAIVDAKALKEAAVKNAETELIEKYADEMKLAVSALLEAEGDLGLGGEASLSPEEAPPAYAGGENVCPCPDDAEHLEIDFSELRAQAEEAEDEGEAMGLGADLGGEDAGGLGADLGAEEDGEEDDEEDSPKFTELTETLKNSHGNNTSNIKFKKS